MANSRTAVLRSVDIHPTDQDKGLRLSIDIRAYDNGLLTVNGIPQGDPDDPRKVSEAIGLVCQYVGELMKRSADRYP